MFRIPRNNPWPAALDLGTARTTLSDLHEDMKRVPQLAKVAEALEIALAEIDRADTKAVEALPPRFTGSKFLRTRF